MKDQITSNIFQEIIATLDIPESAYEKAESRYKDLGDWFARAESKCSKFDPHVYPQGSFRFGTVVRPLGANDEYDLDLGCRLRRGVTKLTHTQKDLKTLIGLDMEEYRCARRIENTLEEKHRCWRLRYEDQMKFHMDTVPSIHEEAQRTRMLMEEMIKAGSATPLAENITSFAGAITDDRLQNYSIISSSWRISNSEGYARWFESRIKLSMALLEKRAFELKAARVDDLPARKWKSPLQQAVQILKRHRDVAFADYPDNKPPSIIITTLAGVAYRGESDTADALTQILSTMGSLINPATLRVSNPVNPAENFAERWTAPKYQQLNLKGNFFRWLEAAKADLQNIGSARRVDLIVEQARSKMQETLQVE